ncbi:hypothetical protein M885DRAFT_448352, partial [Pelagophyceae sp. CCMP2097]
MLHLPGIVATSARCCLGWGLLYNYLSGKGKALSGCDVGPNFKLLAAQGAVAGLDYLFGPLRQFELSGHALVAVVLIFDVGPLTAQSLFVLYLLNLSKNAAKSCC